MASNPSGAQRAAEARAEWVIVLPYSILVVHKRSSDVALRIDLVTRMRAAKLEVTTRVNASKIELLTVFDQYGDQAAKLEVTTRVNAAKSELLILVGAPLERLEREAEHARMRKSLRSSGGYVPFNRSKRHYFGHKVLSEEFFSPAERQELVMRIMVCNHGHSGAALDVAMLRGTHTEAHLKTLPAAQLRRMLADRHPQDAPDGVGEMEVDELAAQLLDRFRTEEKVKAVIPLHSEDWQDAVIEVFRNNNYFALPRPIQLGSRDGVFQIGP
ncbi:hypothetical protein T484DRAFT_1763862 [Baffinella frigidus]|nr:hypothetical protein T484DRAFT_1763862 [Cryptophyta sp. CCMP2293]